MNIRRVVPDIPSKRFEESRAFYMDFLGMKLAMDMDFILRFVSQSNPTRGRLCNATTLRRQAGPFFFTSLSRHLVGLRCRWWWRGRFVFRLWFCRYAQLLNSHFLWLFLLSTSLVSVAHDLLPSAVVR
jgi:hypothetical protein